MKVIIAGSRSITDYGAVVHAIEESGFEIDEVICGGAKGVDELAVKYAEIKHLEIVEFYANWDKYGKAAGPIRNREMAKYADALIAIWDGKSKGTLNMIRTANQYNLPVFVYRPDINREWTTK